jgi:hypothetical protein
MGKIGNLDAKLSWVLGSYWLTNLKNPLGASAENSCRKLCAAKLSGDHSD